MSHETDPKAECVPLFPLEAVLFPGALLPLHVFEPRYRQMTADAINRDGTIAVALLRPGYESEYHSCHAPIYPVVGIGRIVAARQFSDGTYNIVLRGLRRGRILSESTDRPYRVARIDSMPDELSLCEHSACMARCELLTAIEDSAIPIEFRTPWLELLRTGSCLGAVVDQICGSLPCDIDVALRQNLQEEPNTISRAKLLTEYLKTISEVARKRIRCAQKTTGRTN